MSDVVNITIAVQDQVSATIATVGTQGPAGEVDQSAIEALAFSYLTLNDTGLVAEYRLSALDGRLEYFPVLGGTTQQIAYVSDLDDYVLTSAMQAAPTKATPIDADGVILIDSEESNAIKRTLWSAIKSTLKTYFDTLYQAVLVSGTSIKTINGSSLLGAGDVTVGGSTDASLLTTGTLPDARLSSNVAKLNQAQTFVGNQAVTGNITASGTIVMGANGNSDASFGLARSGNITQIKAYDQVKVVYGNGVANPFYLTGTGELQVSGAIVPGANGNGDGYFGLSRSGNSSLFKAYDGLRVVFGNGISDPLVIAATGKTTTIHVVCMGIFTVSTLPAASSNIYAEANVSDSLAPTIGSTVASGGSAKAKVWSNGTNWIVIGK